MKAIVTKYISPTERRGARIKASDLDGNRVTIPYPHELSGEAVHRKAADALLVKMGWSGDMTGGAIKDGYEHGLNTRGLCLCLVACVVCGCRHCLPPSCPASHRLLVLPSHQEPSEAGLLGLPKVDATDSERLTIDPAPVKLPPAMVARKLWQDLARSAAALRRYCDLRCHVLTSYITDTTPLTAQ